jgi:DNA-binding NarL/FixJ family response regulator
MMSSRSDAVPAGAGTETASAGIGRTILVVDREEIALWGFSFLFSRQSWVRRCLVSNHPTTAVDRVRNESVDVALLDDRFGALVLGALLADIAAIAPEVRPMIVASQPSADHPDGVALIDRTWNARRIVSAVHGIADDPAAVRAPASRPGLHLSVREREVLALMAHGKTNREIALRLCLSPHTIKQHTCSAYRKLRARNRAEAVTRAMALGLII